MTFIEINSRDPGKKIVLNRCFFWIDEGTGVKIPDLTGTNVFVEMTNCHGEGVKPKWWEVRKWYHIFKRVATL